MFGELGDVEKEGSSWFPSCVQASCWSTKTFLLWWDRSQALARESLNREGAVG